MLLKLHFLFHGNNLQKQYTLEIMVQIIGYQQIQKQDIHSRAHKLNITIHSLKTESKHLKGQLDPPVSDVTFFAPKEVSWTPP